MACRGRTMSESWPSRAPWRLLGRDQLVLSVLSVLLLGAAAVRYVLASLPSARGVERLAGGERIDYRVDLNCASEKELALLPGIGPARAARITEFRRANGPFRSLAGLARVPGMNRGMVEKLRGLVTPEGAEPPGEAGQ